MNTETLFPSPSILDNDFYKFTMQCAVMQLFPDVKARYTFINRGAHAFPEGFGEALKAQVASMASLQLTREEHRYLALNCPYLNAAYLDLLAGYRYDPSEVHIVQEGEQLEVSVEGHWFRTILWEVPLLFLISELYYERTGQQREDDGQVVRNTIEKTSIYKELDVPVAEFGTRRRHSFSVQQLVVDTLTQHGGKNFVGTSNVHLAMRSKTKPIGTHAHEWFMFHAAKYGFTMANALSLEHWTDVYRGDLGVALSDTYTNDVFFEQFDKKFAKLFDGVRHDSGDPIAYAEKVIAHYRSLGINPAYKFIIFSDGLNTERVAEITHATKGKIGISFGIGTNLTNDVGLKPMNIVMKLTAVQFDGKRWVSTVKLSDEKGKHTGEPRMIRLAKEVLGIE
ncbi:nicotinate phosphoribosyltransferase [Niabella pedocola]|uniref:Nicotinate phosphoribosyltransferase n=1 Tax=Niabella pedocola TaxID=1752077 RepID=A0ABS8PMQ5_9BACT|nr:nicotinate phosphoribosyltransferase [Niabella pedocola]MCD2422388.1 nicotinate phosphoribosyltransferase [Niabella pedocola]